MTRDRGLLLALALLTVLGLFTAEGRYRRDEETAPSESDHHRHRHRHRHRHETTSLPAKRNHHHHQSGQDLEYEDADANGDRDHDRDGDGDAIPDSEDQQEEYEARPYYERSHSRSAPYHPRAFEPRYPPPRYHHRSGYRGWYENEDNERRRPAPPPPPPPPRNRPFRSQERSPHHRRTTYPKNLSHPPDDYEYSDEDDEYGWPHGKRAPKMTRKHRTSPRHPWQGRTSDTTNHRPLRRYHVDNVEAASASSRKLDDWRRRRLNSSEQQPAKHDKRRHNDDYDYQVDETEGTADREEQEQEQEEEEEEEEEDEEEEEEDIWREAESEDDTEDEDEHEDEDEDGDELDNDFSKSERKAPWKTYDDIIRRLTSDDRTTPRSTVKRDYRNIKYVGNFKYERRNVSRSLSPESAKSSSPYVGSTSNYYSNRKSSERTTLPSKDSSLAILVKGNDRREKKASESAGGAGAGTSAGAGAGKSGDSHARTKSLEQDYDEYLNSPDTEKEEDLIKAGLEDQSGMQADVTNTDYGEDENLEENETPATPKSIPTPAPATTTTTTTTTTPRSLVTQHYEYRDPRAYESGTGVQYNGYQTKKEYAPMSAHSAQKWQSLGTREGVKETRSNVQQYNKNGKSAEIREALQHAIKVSREGSCQWPRPRVIPVRDVYPSPSTTYIPHCAILHRCSDDTGCCRSDALTCVPKHSHRVQLSFYTTSVNGSSVVEKLSFYNHTECECKERTEYDSPNDKSPERFYRHYPSAPQPQNMRRPTAKKPCRCPSQFTPRITPEGKCQCHCYENNHNCIKTRRGKGYFSLADRTCIEREVCAQPICEFGEYMHKPGKCPRREDRFEAIANFRTNLRHRY